MPKVTRTRPRKISTQPELLDLIPRMRMLPNESAVDFEHLRQAFLLELAPATPYQSALAESLIALEWDIHRYRRMWDSLIRTRYKNIAQCSWAANILTNHPTQESSSKEAKAFANALISPGSEGSDIALDWLAERNIDPGELVAKAYGDVQEALAPLERTLTELETRRRRMREDFDRLQATRARPIEDATIVDGK